MKALCVGLLMLVFVISGGCGTIAALDAMSVDTASGDEMPGDTPVDSRDDYTSGDFLSGVDAPGELAGDEVV